MKIRPVLAELFHMDTRTDGRKDKTKLILAFRNCANASKNLFRMRLLKIIVFWKVTSFSPVEIYRNFVENCSLQLQDIGRKLKTKKQIP